MLENTNQKEFWDSAAFASDYCQRQIDGLKRFAVPQMVDAAMRKTGIKPLRILEIGGGSQIVSRQLSEIFPSATIICTDFAEARVEAFKRYYDETPANLTVEGGIDARSLPYADGQFDLIIGDAMLHHIDFLKPALFEIRRCLAPGGKAIFLREPVIGALGVFIYRMFQRTGQARRHIEINYFEYKRMLSQWQYEFMMAGFGVTLLKSWQKQSVSWKLRSLFPHLTPCYLGFILEGRIDIAELDLSDSI
ncbi:class I SAM-dependent methyltransferase [Shinella sumterensis]|uniref:Class I SAM-dependent methyltransferase n=1 Tax=Shinella sumterensis TaxID=1967501 RepID=A0AA50CKV2_9HYPH|nr:class I SAM-dependent methyltransferase [Shinella sumterensis]WLR96191.1 class I SAM-dependent methyltransferase [Shinella sumterensis]